MVCGTAQAGALNKADVGADAKWLFHFDWEKYNSSEMYKLISADPAHIKAHADIASASAMLGFNPAKDITGITAYGVDYKEGQGAVIIKGSIAPEKAAALLEQNTTHVIESYGANVIHTWTAKQGKTGACSFYGNGTVILSKTVATVKAAIDVLDANSASLESDSNGIAVPDMSPDTFILAYADKCEGKVGDNPKAQIFRNVDNLTLAAGETGGNMIAEAQLGAGTADKAALMHSAMSGMLSFAMLGAIEDPALAEMVNALSISIDGQNIKLSFKKNSKELMDFAKKQIEERKKLMSDSNEVQVPAVQ